jgi:hypothetical protein
MRGVLPCASYKHSCSWYISWESNNRMEVANQDVLKWYGLCYDRLSGYDTVKIGISTQSADLHIFQNSRLGRQCLAVCHAKYRIEIEKYNMLFQIAVIMLIIYYWNTNQLVETNPNCWHKIFLLLQTRLEKDVKTLKDKRKEDKQKDREQRRREQQNLRVRFPWH